MLKAMLVNLLLYMYICMCIVTHYNVTGSRLNPVPANSNYKGIVSYITTAYRIYLSLVMLATI